MIPPRENLDGYYTQKELEVLDVFRPILTKMKPAEQLPAGRQLLRKLWPDELEYIEKTHWIATKEPGVIKQLRLNYAQKRFYKEVIQRCREDGVPIRAVVLKARQLGFSTFIQSWQFEQCDRENNRRALTVSYDEPTTEEMFQKSLFIRRNQWFPRQTHRERTSTIEFADNNSIFYTQTAGNVSAGRSLTVHNLHCSEVPMWENPGETLTGLLQAVPVRPDTSIFFESTARGRRGEFYDAWQKAVSGDSPWVPFFAPWFWDPEYSLGFTSPDQRNAFGRTLDLVERRLIERHNLSLEQLHWRRYKIKGELQGVEAKFRQEFPSSADEAFLTSGSPVFDQDKVADLERNVTPPLWTGDINLMTLPK
jgi:hypothetical protein